MTNQIASAADAIRPMRHERTLCFMAFFVGAAQILAFNVVGQLYAGQLICLAALPILAMNAESRNAVRKVAPFYLFLALWFAGQIASDVYRHTEFIDYARGWSRIFFIGVCFTFVIMLARGRPTILAAFLLGGAVGLTGIYFSADDPTIKLDPWKYVIGHTALLGGAVIGSQGWSVRLLGRRNSNVAWLLLVAAISLWLNSRSLFGVATISILYIIFADFVARNPRLAAKVTPTSYVAVIFTGLLIVQGLISLNGILESSGSLGRDAREKYETQTSGDLPVLLGGRVESFASIPAIEDAPILGHGSWPKDPKYLNILIEQLAKHNIPVPTDTSFFADDIPSHSHFLGSYVEAGFLGGLFWAWMFFMCLKALYLPLKQNRRFASVVVVVVFYMAWDIMFSPIGAYFLLLKGAEIAIILESIRIFETSKAGKKVPVSRYRGQVIPGAAGGRTA